MTVAYLGLGSNTGNREEYLWKAIEEIAHLENTCIEAISNIYETDPVGYLLQPDFLNMVVRIRTHFGPYALLDAVLGIEWKLGRERTIRWGPRTVDVDVLTFGTLRLDDSKLTLPHPRLHERAFVLIPLLDVLQAAESQYLGDLVVHLQKAEGKEGVKLFRKIFQNPSLQNWNIFNKWVIIKLDETGSTNDVAKQLALDGQRPFTAIVANRQTGGRGRSGRAWNSNSEEGLWMSIILRPNRTQPMHMPFLTMVISLAVVEALDRTANIKAGIKWPNDIFVMGRKLCGILCESNFSNEQCSFVVVGIGLNLYQDKFEGHLQDIAISLKMALDAGKEMQPIRSIENLPSREKILEQILISVDKYYGLFEKGHLDSLIADYKTHCISLERPVVLSQSGVEKYCFAMDINGHGNLIVKLEDGAFEEIVSGEITLRLQPHEINQAD